MLSKIKKTKKLLAGFAKPLIVSSSEWYRQNILKKNIKVINLNAIDICNSKCQMCNIWKNKEDKKITSSQFKEILSDKLFQNVTHVGVTGGEPTLRNDIVEIYESILTSCPKIQGLSMITNGIKSDKIFEYIKSINSLCHKHGVKFNVMVSLDGVGAVHDNIRGIPGNFQTSEDLIKNIKSEGIPVSIGCTISKDNVWDVDDLLYYMKKNDLYGRFRVAEFIERLYNSELKVIRNFTDEEKYHLATFFHKLEEKVEKTRFYKRTYKSIRGMLLGGKREIGCPYHSQGLVLNSSGEISYCAPKSPILGNALTKSADKIYNENLPARSKLIKDNCNDCIHDYHSSETLREYLVDFERKLQKVFFKTRFRKYSTFIIKNVLKFKISRKKISQNKRVLIVGWYGTETVGDKGILAGIMQDYLKVDSNVEFIIGSIHPYITVQTLKELKVDAEVVDSQKFELFKAIAGADEVVMGGGPLMDLEELMIPYNTFLFGKALGVSTKVFGCGVGPIVEKKYELILNDILRLSDVTFLRDKKSLEMVKEFYKKENLIREIGLFGDPAKKIIEKIKSEKVNGLVQANTLTVFLREWTFEYGKHLSKEEFFIERELFEKGLARFVKSEAKKLGVEQIRMCHMHNFFSGNDDRDYSRRFIDENFSGDDIDIYFDKGLSTIESICEAMMSGKHNLCMRFHSVLFAETLGVEFTAIDYTIGGKIYHYLNDNNHMDKLKSFDEIKNYCEQ